MLSISAALALSVWTLALVAAIVRRGTGTNIWEA